MKVLTKELKHDLELHEIQCAVNSIEKRTLPIVFFNGGCDGVADSALKTIKTNFKLSDKENELKFMIMPLRLHFSAAALNMGDIGGNILPKTILPPNMQTG